MFENYWFYNNIRHSTDKYTKSYYVQVTVENVFTNPRSISFAVYHSDKFHDKSCRHSVLGINHSDNKSIMSTYLNNNEENAYLSDL